MRTTIDIPENLLNNLMAVSETLTKKEAVRIALEEFVRRKKLEKLLDLPGKINISDVSQDLEAAESDEFKGID